MSPHLPQYWRSLWKAICKGVVSNHQYPSNRKDTYEDTSTALSGGALTTETLDLAVGVDLVVLQDGHLDLLALVLDLLGGLQKESGVSEGRTPRKSGTDVVGLLLALLGTTTETRRG